MRKADNIFYNLKERKKRKMLIEIIKFFIYAILIVMISKYMLVKGLRKLAENLRLKPRTIGNIAGFATSIPELLTVTVSSFKGLMGTSLYNIISSNVINFIQYGTSLIINKNYKVIKNKGIIIQNILVIITIIFPIILLKLENTLNIVIAFLLIAIYVIFYWISKKIHERYLSDEDIKIEEREKEQEVKEKYDNKQSFIYVGYILIAGILLYLIGDALGSVLENLSESFGIAEWILGVLLGMITSIPELVTFFEAQNHYKKEEDKNLLGVIEATNNLLTSNMLNLFIIQAIGILIYIIVS